MIPFSMDTLSEGRPAMVHARTCGSGGVGGAASPDSAGSAELRVESLGQAQCSWRAGASLAHWRLDQRSCSSLRAHQRRHAPSGLTLTGSCSVLMRLVCGEAGTPAAASSPVHSASSCCLRGHARSSNSAADTLARSLGTGQAASSQQGAGGHWMAGRRRGVPVSRGEGARVGDAAGRHHHVAHHVVQVGGQLLHRGLPAHALASR